jgi:hypothetical protein
MTVPRWNRGQAEVEQLISRRELEPVAGAAADGTPLLRQASPATGGIAAVRGILSRWKARSPGPCPGGAAISGGGSSWGWPVNVQVNWACLRSTRR